LWLTEGKPDKWTVVTDESRGFGLQRRKVSMTGYLLGVMQEDIPLLAGDYPNANSYVFVPDDTKPLSPMEALESALRTKNRSQVELLIQQGVDLNAACIGRDLSAIRCTLFGSMVHQS